jgi:glycosyltransferase involved in cell wall biosynthesis
LLECIQKIEGIDVACTSDVGSVDAYHNNYGFVHVVLTGTEPIRRASEKFSRSTIFKHIFTPAVNFGNALTTKLYYSLIKSTKPNVTRCYSSEFVARSYFMDDGLVIPPSIDTGMFTNSKEVSGKRAYEIIRSSSKNAWVENILDVSEGLVLYSGPLSQDRFPHRLVLNAIKVSQSKILILGRHTNYDLEAEAMTEIMEYARRLGIDHKVAISLKILGDEEKIDLINFSDVVIQPFNGKIKNVAVDPPIFILESMACCRPVITSYAYSLTSIIRSGDNGYIVDWNNPDNFAEALNGCLTNKKIKSNARQTILEQFSQDEIIKKLKHIYNDFAR